MGTKGITNLPITAVVKGKRGGVVEGAAAQGQTQNIPVKDAPVVTPAGNLKNSPVKKTSKSSPAKWVQFIPMAMSAISSMKDKKDK